MTAVERDLEKIATSGSWRKVAVSKIPLEIVNKPVYGWAHKRLTLIGIAALSGKLDKFPKSLLNPEGILEKNSMEETTLHLAATQCQLDCLPKGILTEENLCSPNKEGTTAIHYAALHGCLDQIPKEIVNKKRIITMENRHGFNVLDFALYAKKNLKDLKCLSTIDENHMEGKEQSPSKKINSQLRIVLSALDENTLKKEAQKTIGGAYIKERKTIIDQELKDRKIKKLIKEAGDKGFTEII